MKYFIIFLSLFIKLDSIAQLTRNESVNSNEYLSIAKISVADNKVNYKGVPNISYNLFNILTNGNQQSINLSYDATGVRVTDYASSFGLKWDLNYGGVIVREVKGDPDELQSERSRHSSKYQMISSLPIITDGSAVSLPVSDMQTIESDIFHYNFGNGVTGSFILGANAITIPLRDLQIIPTWGEINPDDQNNKMGITSFEIIDDQGIRYFFNDYETTITSFLSAVLGENIFNFSRVKTVNNQKKYTSKWHITKIIYPNNSGLFFEYEHENIEMLDPTKFWTRGFENVHINQNSIYNGGILEAQFAFSDQNRTVKRKRIKKIYNSDLSLCFVANTFGISRIEAFSKQNGDDILLKKIHFHHHYWEVDSEFNYLNLFNSPNGYHRLLLDSVVSESKGGDKIRDLYFEYNNVNQPFVSQYSYKIDFWGFYNGENNDIIFPKTYVYPTETDFNDRYRVIPKPNYSGQYFIIDGGNRNPNPLTITTGVIKKIVNKYGGITEYTFESNDFSLEGVNVLGEGIRIKQIKEKENINSTYIVYDYTYKKIAGTSSESSGKLFTMPHFSFPNNSEYQVIDNGNQITVSPINYETIQRDYYKFFLVRSSHLLSSNNSVTQGYSEIQSFTNAVNKVNRQFATPGLFNQKSDDQLNGCNVNESGLCAGLFKRFNVNLFSSSGTLISPLLKGITPTNGLITFPFDVSTPIDWYRGVLLSETYYSSANSSIVKKNKFTYKFITPTGSYSKDLNIKFSGFNSWVFIGQQGIFLNPHLGLNFYTIYENLGDIGLVLEKEEIVDYVNNVPSLNQTVEYQYNGLLHSKPTKIKTYSSQGYILTKEYLYSKEFLRYYGDYGLNNGFDLNGLYSRANNLVAEIETVNRNGIELVTNGIYIKYKQFDFNNYIEPINSLYKNQYRVNYEYSTIDEVLKFESPSPVNRQNFVFTYVLNNGNLNIDPHFKNIKKIDNYNTEAHIIETTDKSEKKSFIKNINNSTIAEATNAKHNEIFHYNFEDNGYDWDGNFCGYDNTKSKTGKQSGRIDNPNSWEKYSHSNTWLQVSNTTTKKYRYSVWVYSTASSVDIFFFMKRANESSYFTYVTAQTTTEQNKWVLLQGEYDVPADITQLNIRLDNNGNGSVWFDDVRLHPADAMMTTYTYEPLIGISSQTDVNHRSSYYFYDAFNRLSLIKDKDGNVLKRICYNYQGQQEVCYTAPIATQPQTIYARVSYENQWWSWPYMYGDVVVRFYSDAAGTIPLNVNGLNIVYDAFDCYSNQMYNNSATANGNMLTLEYGALITEYYYNWWDDSWYDCSYSYILSSGNYTIIP